MVPTNGATNELREAILFNSVCLTFCLHGFLVPLKASHSDIPEAYESAVSHSCRMCGLHFCNINITTRWVADGVYIGYKSVTDARHRLNVQPTHHAGLCLSQFRIRDSEIRASTKRIWAWRPRVSSAFSLLKRCRSRAAEVLAHGFLKDSMRL
jgi:hypothetical protein